MALIVTAFDLVARVGALNDGVDALARAAPNDTFCTDGLIARVSFMHESDRDRFAAVQSRLSERPFARVDKHTRSSDSTWLAVGRYAGVDAAWLVGPPRDPLVVPVSWSPGAVTYWQPDDATQHLEHVGVEGSVDVYRDKRTGKTLYTGRTQPSLPPGEALRIEALRREACEIARPLVIGGSSLGFFERRRVKKAIAMLEEVVEIAPETWSAQWFLGMSRRALGAHAEALEAFKVAYATHPENPDVGREYAAQCMTLGAGDEGVRISRELHARFPDDAGLQSNLALALLIGGDVDEGLAVARAAQKRAPDDPITRNLVTYIIDVKAGRKPRPTRMPGT